MKYINGFAKKEFFEYMYNEFPSVYDNAHSRELLENIVDYCTADNFTHRKNELVYTLEKLIPEITGKEILKFADKSILTNSIFDYYDNNYSFEYQLLDRLKADCDYFLGNGNRYEKHLWAGNVKDQIAKMKELYEILPYKPEWCPMTTIEEYEASMTTITSIKDLKEAIENYGWNISDCNFSNNGIGWEIAQYSPQGEDFSFSIEHNNDIQSAIKEINEYAYNFDEDEHITMWLEARCIDNNRLNVPSPRKLVKDAQDIQKMLNSLSNFCNMLDIENEKEIEMDEPDICE